MWSCVLVTSELGLGIGSRIAGACCQLDGPGFSKRLFRGYSRQWQRGRPYPTRVCIHAPCFPPPPHKDKERNTLLEKFNVKTKKPWAGGMTQGLHAAEPRSKCDSGTHRLEEENRLTPTSCPLSPTYALWNIPLSNT